jgi:hypothetical protein
MQPLPKIRMFTEYIDAQKMACVASFFSERTKTAFKRMKIKKGRMSIFLNYAFLAKY